MGAKITGLAETRYRLERLGTGLPAKTLNVMREGALTIRDTARLYAPVDEGDLEKAIVMRTINAGKFQKKFAEVFVDPKKLGDGYQETGFRYDEAMERGGYELGDFSQMKQDANPGITVGARFMERAFRDNEAQISKELDDMIKGYDA